MVRVSLDLDLSPVALVDRQRVRSLEQGNGAVDIFRTAQKAADPAGVRQKVMRFGKTLRDHLVANAAGERHIDEFVPMHVAQLSLPKALLGPAEAVGGGLHAFKAFHRLTYLCGCVGCAQDLRLLDGAAGPRKSRTAFGQQRLGGRCPESQVEARFSDKYSWTGSSVP